MARSKAMGGPSREPPFIPSGGGGRGGAGARPEDAEGDDEPDSIAHISVYQQWTPKPIADPEEFIQTSPEVNQPSDSMWVDTDLPGEVNRPLRGTMFQPPGAVVTDTEGQGDRGRFPTGHLWKTTYSMEHQTARSERAPDTSVSMNAMSEVVKCPVPPEGLATQTDDQVFPDFEPISAEDSDEDNLLSLEDPHPCRFGSGQA